MNCLPEELLKQILLFVDDRMIKSIYKKGYFKEIIEKQMKK